MPGRAVCHRGEKKLRELEYPFDSEYILKNSKKLKRGRACFGRAPGEEEDCGAGGEYDS